VRLREAEKVEKNRNKGGEELECSRVQLFPFREVQAKIIEEEYKPGLTNLYPLFKG
jgi:hypothetical protein